jgi:fido (protein-threonine AMPylation protein)
MAAQASPIDSVSKVINVHQALGQTVLERGESGVLRPFKHMAGTGYQFSNPNEILVDLHHWCENTLDKDALERHIIYECIHPFSDGNGRSGRLIMAADLNFDFYKLNDLIGDNYINSIVDYQNSED